MYLHKGNCNTGTTVMSVGTLCHRIISYLHIFPEAYNIGQDPCLAWLILFLFGHCTLSMLLFSFIIICVFNIISEYSMLGKSAKAIQHRWLKVSNC